MKRRTFILTLLLFLLTVHGCIVLMAVHTYRGTVEQARERAAAEHYYIASGLLKDIAVLDSRGIDYRQGMVSLAEPYGYIALNQNAGISLYDGETPVYTNPYGEDIGLAICEQIAVKHGAVLSFESVPGNGTTAKIMFTTPT